MVQFIMAPPLQFREPMHSIRRRGFSFEGPIGYEVRPEDHRGDDTAFSISQSPPADVSGAGKFAMWNRVTLGLSRLMADG